MRRISVRVSRAILACTLALAAPAAAGSTDYFLKIKGVEGDSGKAPAADDKHKDQIEILSYSWGETRKVSKVDAITIKQSTTTDDVGQERDYAKEPAGAAPAGRSNDRLRNAGPVSGWPSAQAGEAEITLKGSTIKENAARTRPSDITLKRGTSSAAKPKSGSLSYLNRTRQKELTPASAGSLTVVVAPGHGLCTAGKSLGTLTLAGSGGRSYVLTGVTVAGCEAATAGDRPTEEVSLNYTKIEF